MLEPATTITDFLLTAQCWYFVYRLRAGTPDPARSAFVGMFAFIGAASFAGGLAHGFFPDPETVAQRVLWISTLLALGAASAAMYTLAARLAFPERRIAWLAPVLGALWVGYAAFVVLVSDDFAVAVGAYLPAVLLVAVVLLGAWRSKPPRDGSSAGLAGIALTLIGAAGQQAGIGIHPVHFDHNAVYHVVQMVALYLLYRCAVQMTGAPSGSHVAA